MEAKHQNYMPAHRWMLEHKAINIIERLRKKKKKKTIVLLDYNTCCKEDKETKKHSHAYLVKAYAEGLYPFDDLKLSEETEKNKENSPRQLSLFD